jgi:hypothetical protein
MEVFYSILSFFGLAIYEIRSYMHQAIIEGGVKLQFEGSVITEQGVKFAIVGAEAYGLNRSRSLPSYFRIKLIY